MFGQSALIPHQPHSPKVGEALTLSPSPKVGEGFRVRAASIGMLQRNVRE
ncbi:hypothetical protein J0895_12665 [Phormidium pseudopriestleyi FRX01]|uniref:Uncharacterized protein n=1 Tax=Phormidium pseudopriestleyi FRX01 TaxID=1759528 RepID=A0ABS3FS65_9CYAN|nr:hypothetical protein [Phormidium pseudopriestleyi]MBO0349951.1 hypothetical protein [Phormidium pseudopriestleyi FRX01]